MSAPLTQGQKRYLARLAARAHRRATAAIIAGQHLPDYVANVDFWRHQEVARACGKAGLRCCSQDDYGAVKAHFLNLLGEPGAALRADIHGQPGLNQTRIVLWKIARQCERLGVPVSYADAICRQMHHGHGLHQVERPAALWKVFFALRYRQARTANLNKQQESVPT